jgi:hypothetical protein
MNYDRKVKSSTKEGKSKPPEKLENLFQLIGLLSADISFPTLNRVKSENAHNYRDYNPESRLNRNKTPFEIWTFDARWELANKLKGLPQEIRQYIYKDAFIKDSEPSRLKIENRLLKNHSTVETDSSISELNMEVSVDTGVELFPLEIEIQEETSQIWTQIITEHWHPVLNEIWVFDIHRDSEKAVF